MNRCPFPSRTLALPLLFAGFSHFCGAVPEEIERSGLQPSISQQAYLKASNTEKNDFFDTVAISGDTVIVGAPYEDSKATGVGGEQANNRSTNSGAAYVFTRSDTTWTRQAYLKASDTGKNDQFGFSVAISGDTAVVGAFGNTSQTGAAYVFTRSGSTWAQQAVLEASNAEKGDLFGYSVAVSGDTIVIGAFGETSNAGKVRSPETDVSLTQAGAAYVFTRSSVTWTEQAHLKSGKSGRGDLFGIAVAIAGERIVVGAPGEDSGATGVSGDEADNGASQSGAAYVFARKGTTWKQQAYLKASNTGDGDLFGRAVAISGNVVVVGAPQESGKANNVDGDQTDNSASQAGAAYVFARNSKGWKQQAYLKASNSEEGDQFGFAVAATGEMVVVGAYGEDSGANGLGGDPSDNRASLAGAAYVFVKSGTTWRKQAYLKATKSDKGDQFGFSVAAAGTTAVISASGEASKTTKINGAQDDDSSPNAGAAYVFHGFGSVTPEISVEAPPGTRLADNHGGIAFEGLAAGTSRPAKVITLRNTGTADLNRLSVTLDGADASNYSLSTTGMKTTLAPGEKTTFTVSFNDSGTATTRRVAAIHIASNDLDENPFDIPLKGRTFSTVADKDGDSLNDWAEFQYAKLGFDWEVSQPELVAKLRSGANSAGLFTASEVHTLNLPAPLLVRDAGSGQFKLTLGLQKSNGLNSFIPFPMPPPDATINSQGKLEFLFSSSDGAAFFRVQAQ